MNRKCGLILKRKYFQASMSTWFLNRGVSAYKLDVRAIRVIDSLWIYVGERLARDFKKCSDETLLGAPRGA